MTKNPAEQLVESLAAASHALDAGDTQSVEKLRERTRQQMVLMLASFQKHCRAGHQCLLDELLLMRSEGVANIADIKEYAVEFPDLLSPLTSDEKRMQTPQELAGIGEEHMLDFYDAAVRVYDSGHYDEAVAAGIFLTTMNPFVQAFWLLLALAYEGAAQPAQAFDAYRYAIAADGETPDVYDAAVTFCLRCKNSSAAQSIVDNGTELIRAMPDEAWCSDLSTMLDVLQAKIDEQSS